MRRGALTQTRQPFKAGMTDALFASGVTTFVSGSIRGSYASYAGFTGPPRSGILTGVKMHFYSGSGSVAVFTANPSTLVVRGITENLTVTSGADIDVNFAAPIPIEPGDLIGTWTNQNGGGNVLPAYFADSTGGVIQYTSNNTTKPSVGSDLDGGGWFDNIFGAGTYVLCMQVRGLA